MTSTSSTTTTTTTVTSTSTTSTSSSTSSKTTTSSTASTSTTSTTSSTTSTSTSSTASSSSTTFTLSTTTSSSSTSSTTSSSSTSTSTTTASITSTTGTTSTTETTSSSTMTTTSLSTSSTGTASSTTNTATTSTGTSVSATTTSQTATTTTTTMQTWCRKFYGGVAIESGTCQAGALEHDHCLTPREGNELSCGTIAHCPSASNSSGGQCDRCATVLAEDWNQEIRLSGDLRWAPFGATEAEELQLAGYDISVVDECGVELLKLGRVPMQMGKSYDVQECCSSNWYSWIIQNELVPREMVAISISTWQDNLATTIPIYTSFITSTTFLTVTSTTATVP
ncbi:unnamed protein product [Durusdinium trenchii]|uniref:Uncharacterized protein n=1 Tax=Durusdinium trenchii TaxID=1381693 RepID=A0ABP0HAX6_9DINO